MDVSGSFPGWYIITYVKFMKSAGYLYMQLHVSGFALSPPCTSQKQVDYSPENEDNIGTSPCSNRTYIFKWWMFHCHVSFRGGYHQCESLLGWTFKTSPIWGDSIHPATQWPPVTSRRGPPCICNISDRYNVYCIHIYSILYMSLFLYRKSHIVDLHFQLF